MRSLPVHLVCTMCTCARWKCASKSRGCAPLNSGLMKLLSRCAGSTRADPGARVARAAVTPASNADNFSGVHAIDVGQNAVTPYFGRMRRDPRHRLLVVEHIDALDAVDVHVDETGNDHVTREIEIGGAGGFVDGAIVNGFDAAVADDDRAGVDDAVRQDEDRRRRERSCAGARGGPGGADGDGVVCRASTTRCARARPVAAAGAGRIPP